MERETTGSETEQTTPEGTQIFIEGIGGIMAMRGDV